MTRRRLPRPRWTNLLILVGVVSATPLSLSSIESLDDTTVSSFCNFAYNTPLRGCHISDFQQASACSARCRLYIERAEFNIQAACSGADAGSDSLLYKAQNGQLVNALCDEVAETTTKTVVVPRPTRTTAISALEPSTVESMPTTTEEEPSETTRAEPTTVVTSIVPSIIESTSTEPTSTSADTSALPDTTTIAPTSSNDADEPAAPTSTTQSGNNNDNDDDDKDGDDGNNDDNNDNGESGNSPIPGSGGGSPADFISGSDPMRLRLSVALFGAGVVVLALAL